MTIFNVVVTCCLNIVSLFLVYIIIPDLVQRSLNIYKLTDINSNKQSINSPYKNPKNYNLNLFVPQYFHTTNHTSIPLNTILYSYPYLLHPSTLI